jgi:hypothetical protein
VVRLPQVHNTVKQGLVSSLIAIARDKRVSAYVGGGLNRWAAVHVLDAARLYRLALEKQEAGARYHAVAKEGVPARDIAETIGRVLNVPVISKSPEEATTHFGWLARFAARDLTGSSAQTQQRLGWFPARPGLIADLEQMRFRRFLPVLNPLRRCAQPVETCGQKIKSMQIKDHVFLVTGASSGIGLEEGQARYFANERIRSMAGVAG